MSDYESSFWRRHRFGATNAPGSCLWCGRKLRFKHRVERQPVERTDTKCCRAGWDLVGCCLNCGQYAYRSEYKAVSRTRMHDKPGPYGDGFFCSLYHGYLFAVALARGGRRLTSAAEREAFVQQIKGGAASK